MFNVLNCIVYEHDLRLVALSAFICILGCYTCTTLLSRRRTDAKAHSSRWVICAAVIFGCSVWSLHFVAMLAFLPEQSVAYDLHLTILSVVVAAGGTMAALIAWHLPLAAPERVLLGGALLGLAIVGMHYVGVAAMTFSGFLVFEWSYVVASVAISISFATLALARATHLQRPSQRAEVTVWLSLAICGLHFTGMTAVTIVPGVAMMGAGTVLGSSSLAVAVGSVSIVILIASLAASMVENHLSQRTLRDLSRLRLMSNLAQEALFIYAAGIVLEVNNAGERLYKAPAGEIIGHPMLNLFSEDSVPALLRRESCAPADRKLEEIEFRAIDGTRVPVEISCQPIEYLGRPATAIALRNLTIRKQDEARILHLARHDPLTNLPNRYNLMERLDAALDMAARQKDSLAITYIDLDRFKCVNDLHGHAAGDNLLVQTAKRILAELQPTDTLARIGGDEFVLVLRNGPHPERASVVAARIIEALRHPFQIEGNRIEIGASVGIAIYPDDGATPDTLLRAADAALYLVKQEGRGALRFYEASMNAQLQARLQLEQELAKAIERGELTLHYQPLVNGASGVVETFEALVRWQHPRRGMVFPSEFIPLAEEAGLIDEIGRWVIETACQAAASWEKPWRVSVNVSPTQFHHSDICGIIAAALQFNSLDPARIVVEVTESVLIDDSEKAVVTLNRLRELGIRIALDDFGTGYSSLNYLQLFKFDKIKIDKSFIKKITQSTEALTITKTIVNLGHNLGLDVTAEGVETQAQLEIVRALGCDQIQGYLVARPGPMAAFTSDDHLQTAALFQPSQLRLLA